MFTFLLQLCVFAPAAFSRSCICEKYQPVSLEQQGVMHSPLPMEKPLDSVVTPIIKTFHISVNLILLSYLIHTSKISNSTENENSLMSTESNL